MTTSPAGFFPKFLWFFACILWTGGLSCNRFAPEPPAPTEMLPPLELPESQFHLPVMYDVKDFENWINEKITGTFIEQGIKLKNGKDSVYVKVKKLSDIKLSIQNDRLIIDLPVRVRGTYFTRVFGKRIRNLNPIKTDVHIRFSSKVKLERNWHLRTQTELAEFIWISEPVVYIVGIKFNLKEPLEKLLKDKKEIIIAKLDAIAFESLHLTKPLTNAWRNLQKPKKLGKQTPALWLKFKLNDIYADKIELSDSGKMNVNLIVTGHAYMNSDTLKLPPSTTVLPDFIPMALTKDTFDISVLAVMPYSDINTILNNKLGQAKIGKLGRKIRVNDVQVFGTGKQLIVGAELRGLATGKLYLVGNPTFHPESSRIKVTNFQYDINSENAMVGFADSWLHDQLRDTIASNLDVDLSPLIDQLPTLISEAIEKGRAASSIELNFQSFDITDCEVVFLENEMQVLVRTQGKAQLELQKLKVRKKLRVR